MRMFVWNIALILCTAAIIADAQEYPTELPDGTYTVASCITNACPCTDTDEIFTSTFDMPGDYSLQIPETAMNAGSMICTTIETADGDVVRESMATTPCNGVTEVRHFTNKKRSMQSKMAKKSKKQLLAFIKSALMDIESPDQGDAIITAITNYYDMFNDSDTNEMMNIVTDCNREDQSMMDVFMTSDNDDALINMDTNITTYMTESDERYTRLSFAEDTLTDDLLQTDASIIPDRLKDKLATNHEWRLALGRVNQLIDRFDELKIVLIQNNYDEIVYEVFPDIDQLITDLSEEKETLLVMKPQKKSCNGNCYDLYFGSDGEYENMKRQKSKKESKKSIKGKSNSGKVESYVFRELDQTEYVLYQLLIYLTEPVQGGDEEVELPNENTNNLGESPADSGASKNKKNKEIKAESITVSVDIPSVLGSIEDTYQAIKNCKKNTELVNENETCAALSQNGTQTCLTLVPEPINAPFCAILDLNAQTYLPTKRQQ